MILLLILPALAPDCPGSQVEVCEWVDQDNPHYSPSECWACVTDPTCPAAVRYRFCRQVIPVRVCECVEPGEDV